MAEVRRIDLLGTFVDVGYEMKEVIKKVEEMLRLGGSHYICTTNPEFIMEATSDNEFKDMINGADLSLPDGSGVVMADYYLRRMNEVGAGHKFFTGLRLGLETAGESFRHSVKFVPKITGVELSEEIFKLSAEKGYSIFLLGGKVRDWRGRSKEGKIADVAVRTAEIMRKKYPQVKIVGATSEFSKEDSDDISTIGYIKKCMSKEGVEVLDFILVAYGQKNQEKWILRNSAKIPCKISLGVGGTFDYLSGVSKKPGDKIIFCNLEWLFRLFTQPWRLGRIVKAFPLFPIRIFLKSLK